MVYQLDLEQCGRYPACVMNYRNIISKHKLQYIRNRKYKSLISHVIYLFLLKHTKIFYGLHFICTLSYSMISYTIDIVTFNGDK